MKIFGGQLTPAQIGAGLAVMKGQFDSLKVMNALGAAGVKNVVSGAEVLINHELRLGRIRRVTQGIYEER